MTTISDRDSAEAQAMYEAFFDHATPAVSDSNVRRWLAVRDCVLASHTCQPVWRPTTREEIQVGWEVRSRYESGHEATWGAAHHRDDDGDWRAGSNVLLTNDAAGWTYETTAPLPEPAPDPRIQVVVDYFKTSDENALDLLTRLDNLTKGEQS